LVVASAGTSTGGKLPDSVLMFNSMIEGIGHVTGKYSNNETNQVE
jgi:hypothetical protein